MSTPSPPPLLLDLDVVIITLDRANVKRAQRCFRNAIERLGFGADRIHFLDATRGSALSDQDIANLVTPRARHELRHGRFDTAALSGVNSVGCFLSHRDAWQRCVESKRDLVVMEDDYVTRNQNVQDFAETYAREMPRGGGGGGGGVLRCGYTFDFQGAMFYIVSPEAAAALLRQSDNAAIDCHVDHYLNFMHDAGEIRQHFSTQKYYSFLDLITTGSTISHNQVRWNVAWWKLAALCALVSAATTIIVVVVMRRRHRSRKN